MTALPEFLRGPFAPAPPPTANAAPAQQIRWLREFLRPYAHFCAMLAISGEEEHCEARCEIYLAAAQTARALDWPFTVAQAAAPAEFEAALAFVRAAADRIISAVQWRVRRREPGEEILVAARLADSSCVFPEEIIIELCAKVALARARPRVRA